MTIKSKWLIQSKINFMRLLFRENGINSDLFDSIVPFKIIFNDRYKLLLFLNTENHARCEIIYEFLMYQIACIFFFHLLKFMTRLVY